MKYLIELLKEMRDDPVGAIKLILILVFIALYIVYIASYFITCVPYWFQPIVNAPLFCVGTR